MAYRFRGMLRPFHSGSNSSSSSSYSALSSRFTAFSGGGVEAMDMTHAPGYRIAADSAPVPSVNARMAAFAIRHGGVPADSVAAAPGYLWVGSVIYPAANTSTSWSEAENSHEVHEVHEAYESHESHESHEAHEAHHANDDNTVVVSPRRYPTINSNSNSNSNSGIRRPSGAYTKRRYTGGQARRIRQQRQDSSKQTSRRNTEPKGDAAASGEDS